MKILKIFGIVAGIHVFALVVIFANPGCSSTTKPTPAPTDTTASTPAAPVMTPAPASGTHYSSGPSSSPITFNPDAPAVAASGSGSTGSGRYTPTRPGSAAAGALVSEPVADVTPATTYTVKAGDTLSAIAKKQHVTIAELTAANNLKPTAVLRPGQKLLIPGKPSSPTAAATPNPQTSPTKPADPAPGPAPASARTAGGSVKHTVKTGETLGSIARTYGVKAADIAVANNITDPGKIKAGTELVIPGWESPSGKSGKSTPRPATKSVEPKARPPVEQPVEQPVTQPPPSQPPAVPVIRVDESPITPAPKS